MFNLSKRRTAPDQSQVLARMLVQKTKAAVSAEWRASRAESERDIWKAEAETRWDWIMKMKAALEKAAETGSEEARELLAEWNKPVRIDWYF